MIGLEVPEHSGLHRNPHPHRISKYAVIFPERNIDQCKSNGSRSQIYRTCGQYKKETGRNIPMATDHGSDTTVVGSGPFCCEEELCT